jgi:hypothetical protein
MATLTVNNIAQTGLVESLASATVSDDFDDDGQQQTYIEVGNGGVSSTTVTIPAQIASQYVQGVGLLTVPNIVVTIAAGQRRKIGPFTAPYINVATRRVTAQFSGTTSVTVGAFRLPRTV